MNRLLLALFLITLFFVPACQASGSDPSHKDSASSKATAAGSVADAAPATIIARVNGKDIPSVQLEQTLKLYVERSGRDPKSIPASQIQDLRKQLLDDLVNSELLYQASEAAKISVTDHDITQKLQALQGKFPSDQEFTRYLQEQGLTLEEMKARIRRNLMTEQLVKRDVDSKISVSDSEISDYYGKNKDRLRRPELVKVSEIFVRAGSKASADSKAKARQKIQALLKEVRSGKDFASLARQFSESPDAKDGGDMGYISRSGTLPALSQAAFKLNVGEVSDVVESPFGYHLLKVTDKKSAGDVTLKEAKPRISEILFQQKEREALNAYLDKLKAAAKIEILSPTP
jgi:peptidyl-prolyl cis-trans isomerase C